MTWTKLEQTESRYATDATCFTPLGDCRINRPATRVKRGLAMCSVYKAYQRLGQSKQSNVANMADTETTLDLSSIGRELDIARRSRTITGTSDLVTVPEDDSVSDSESASSSSPPVIKTALPTTLDDEDQLYPTCLLCFTRPPSAVLLPCMCTHLDL